MEQPASNADTEVLPGCFVVPAIAFALAITIGGTVLMCAAGFRWFPLLTASVLGIVPLLTDEPWPKKFALSIAGLTTLGLSFATFPLFLLLFEWEWYERHFNDKGTGPLGFFLFTIVFVLTTGLGVYRISMRMFNRPTLCSSIPQCDACDDRDRCS